MAESRIERVFDLPVLRESSVSASRFEEFFPSDFLRFNVSKSEEDSEDLLAQILDEALKDTPLELMPPDEDELPLPYFFSSCVVTYDRKGRLESVGFRESSLPIRRNSILRLYDLFEEAVGPSDSVQVKGAGPPGIPSEIFVSWKRPEGLLMLELETDGLIQSGSQVSLKYYPKGSSRLEYVDRVKKTDFRLGASIAETVKTFLEHHSAFHEGDGPFPPIPLDEALEGRLAQYAETTGLKDSLSFRTNLRLNELHGRLEAQLTQEFAIYPVPDRYQRILDLAISSRSGESQVGAAAFLAHYDDPATQPFLRQGLKVGLPSGVSSYSAVGLAKFCTGELLRQTVEDFLLDKNHAGLILSQLSTREQIGELWKIRDRIPDGNNQRRLDGILTLAERNLE